jgi:uncharacterized protein YprB with RNaseH-like and TPR domain
VFASTLEEERNALLWLKEKLKGCELIVTWYGSGFDIPFILSRSLLHEIDMRELVEIPMLDLCEWSKAHLILSSHSLQSVAKFLGVWEARNFAGPDVNTLFKLFVQGNQEARTLIIQHCREDLLMLKRIHEKLQPLVSRAGGSPRRISSGE